MGSVAQSRIWSVGPFGNVYVNKDKQKIVNFSLYHFSTFEFWEHVYRGSSMYYVFWEFFGPKLVIS